VRNVIAGVILIGLAAMTNQASAQRDDCKTCREYNKACTQAHSKEACKSEFDICMKHCRQS